MSEENAKPEGQQVSAEAAEIEAAASADAPAGAASPETSKAAKESREAKGDVPADGAAAAGANGPAKKSKASSIALGVAAVAVVAALGVGAYCFLAPATSNSTAAVSDPALKIEDTTGGVAAVVGDTQIGEKAITSNIEQFREGAGLTTDEAWGNYLAELGETPESFRASTLSTYIYQELLRQAAAQQGVTVDAAAVDAQVAESRAAAESDEEWRQSLADAGMTEEMYRSNVESGLRESALVDKAIGQVTASDAEVLEYITTYTIDYKKATSLSDIPTDVVKRYRDICDRSKQSKALSDWMADFEKSVNVERYDMPSGLSYDIDLSSYE